MTDKITKLALKMLKDGTKDYGAGHCDNCARQITDLEYVNGDGLCSDCVEAKVIVEKILSKQA